LCSFDVFIVVAIVAIAAVAIAAVAIAAVAIPPPNDIKPIVELSSSVNYVNYYIYKHAFNSIFY
jgi:hypothetical protein